MIYTFYSYKGGVGRSMILANLAELCYQSELRVLIVDWDLEAPGLERFFDVDQERVIDSPGVLDMVLDYQQQFNISSHQQEEISFLQPTDCIIDVHADDKSKGKLYLITAGRRSKNNYSEYSKKVLNFDWKKFYDNYEGELYFEWLRHEFEKIADIIFIDSRTGVTEMGGVCTYQFADIVILFCTPNEQSLDGTYKMVQNLNRPQVKELRGDRDLKTIVIPARIEISEGEKLNAFEKKFNKLFQKYIPKQWEGYGRQAFWELQIPYVPYFAYEERLAVTDTSEIAKRLANPVTLLFDRLKELDESLKSLEDMVLRIAENYIETSNLHDLIVQVFGQDTPRLRLNINQVQLAITSEDRADLRWYFEDYLQYPMDPAPEIAARIEKRMRELGIDLFKKVFQHNEDARDMWARLSPRLDEARIEVLTDVVGATALPWELLRDPKTGDVLALRARSFVRAYLNPVIIGPMPVPAEKVRVLLVICRPGGDDDVPFRSVAGQMIKGLGDEDRGRFDLEVLRPPTFEQLAKTLRQAKARGQPYHIVHFDGHGTYLDTTKVNLSDLMRGLSSIILSSPRSGSHGYLFFENPALQGNIELVDGPALGKLLVEADVPVLVLNACRSAHADLQTAPAASEDPHSQVRAFGSLAQEVMDAGAAGVVAMRYNVYVVTAAQFVADLYAALASGMSLGEAASLGRKQLAAQPLRSIAFEPRPLQDWPVPVVYEAAPVRLFPAPSVGAEGLRPYANVTLDLDPGQRPQDALPRPEAGFFGRDETLLALDRAFDQQRIVLLHAYAGSGKTMTAAEFARWYLQTGGLDGPVLFTAFTDLKPLPRVLDDLEETFRTLFQQNNIQWGALSDEQRLNLTMQIFKQIPVLWIWDNVELVAGFPARTSSAWTEAEQRELKSFLVTMATMTKAKFLLTSRRDEQAWLGELPARVKLPPMPLQEMVQLARALAEKRGARLESVDDWRPLLDFTRGNPLALTALVGQALRDGLKTKEQVEAYARRLRAGEAAFTDDEQEGRSKSLGASLAYGFEQAFSEVERKALAVLALFQGFVDANVLALISSGIVKVLKRTQDMLFSQIVYETRADKHISPVTYTELLSGKTIRDDSLYLALPQSSGDQGYLEKTTEQTYKESSRVGLNLPEEISNIKQFSAMNRDNWITLLDRAAEIGLLEAHGDGYYSIHPVLPWFFNDYYAQYYPPTSPGRGAGGEGGQAERAFVEALGALGAYYHEQYQYGHREVIGALRAEQANLLHARRLALLQARRAAQEGQLERGWWGAVISAMQGLRALYDHTGRRAEWRRLVEQIVPDFVGPDDQPLPGREEQWSLVTEYRVLLAKEDRRWAEAERLQHVQVDWCRQRAAAALARPAGELSAAEVNTIRSLAVSLEQLGHIQREQGNLNCKNVYKEAIPLYQRIGDRPAEAVAAFNLGHTYTEMPSLRDLKAAESWYRQSLELRAEGDQNGRAITVGQLGLVAYQRFQGALQANAPQVELLEHLNAAAGFYYQALELISPDAVDDMAVTHAQLGNIYGRSGNVEIALMHYNQSVHYTELAGNLYAAGSTRFNVALTLVNAGRFNEALLYARAALRNFEPYGQGAAEGIQNTQRLIAQVEEQMRGGG